MKTTINLAGRLAIKNVKEKTMNRTIENNKMKSTIFFTISLFALTLLCQPFVYGQIPAAGKAPMKPNSQPTPHATKQEKLSGKVIVTKSPNVEIKKFYIVEGGASSPFTAMVTFKNSDVKPVYNLTVYCSIYFLDENKKIIMPLKIEGAKWGNMKITPDKIWGAYTKFDVIKAFQPGEHIVKVPFYPPSHKLSPSNEQALKGKKWKLGIKVMVTATPSSFSGIYTDTYIDFLPEQYIQP